MATAISLFFAWKLDYTTLWGSFLVNLAGGALTIAFTAALVEYLLAKERATKLKDTLELIQGNMNNVSTLLLLQLGRLYGIKYDWNETVKSMRENIQKNKNTASAIDSIRVSLDAIALDDVGTKIDIRFADEFINTVKNIQSTLDETISLYDDVLPVDVKGKVLKFRKWVSLTPAMLNVMGRNINSKDGESIIKIFASRLYKEYGDMIKAIGSLS